MKTDIYNKDGSVSAYGLACGYVDVTKRQTEHGEIEVRLSNNGCTFDVDTWGLPDEFIWVDAANGGKIRGGWAQFDRLSDARKFAKRVNNSNVATVGDWIAQCLAAMSHL